MTLHICSPVNLTDSTWYETNEAETEVIAIETGHKTANTFAVSIEIIMKVPKSEKRV